MSRGTIDDFCTQVCRCVRFWPDHEAITAELTAHLEDHAAALEARGLSPEEAAAQAVTAMGDPAELGRQLDAAHPPLLHLTVRITTLLLAFLLITFSVLLMRWGWDTLWWKVDDHRSLQEDLNLHPSFPMDEWAEVDGLRLHFYAVSETDYFLYVYFSRRPDGGWLPDNSNRVNSVPAVKNVPGNVFYRFVDDAGRSYGVTIDSHRFVLLGPLAEEAQRLWLEGDVFGHTFRIEIPIDWREAS
ncbi:permease prefix domain 1-containing protein [Flavonifractor plautii]|uniref:permease prefix domain 1-containing protein n=1 Tax=Flavonifractor plautii TaxID=292800 RepID=UPI00214BE0D0|nr:permease prefix domain 1-containing protein [Flavonifractor plautii]MCR1922960.1 permease prefix domain 1-containing protein [Flavonifractor plautii]